VVVEEEQVDIAEVLARLRAAERERDEAAKRMDELLAELGYARRAGRFRPFHLELLIHQRIAGELGYATDARGLATESRWGMSRLSRNTAGETAAGWPSEMERQRSHMECLT
jgi:hypothetical protein